MAGFVTNRRWTFILALGASLICCSVANHPAAAGGDDGPPGAIIGDPSNPDPSGGTSGDPDVPTGPGKNARGGKLQRGGMIGLGASSAGDGRASGSVWMMRLRIVLLSFRSYTIRF